MIIKSIFRRYKRWNPVHPTSGAFWGVGLGIGCGVGWGPGFGPEVIGYVGAGCGVGFSVGITFLGIGIGLPANYLLQVPRSAFMLTRRGALEVARAGNLLVGSSFEGDVWENVSSHISDPQHNLHSSFPRLKIQHWTEIMKSLLVVNARRMNDHLLRTGQGLFPQDKGSNR